MSQVGIEESPTTGYRHEAFFYADPDEFMDRTLRFIRDAIVAEAPVLVVLDAPKIAALSRELGTPAGVEFADMVRIGSNPARIIPAWQEFVADHSHSGQRLRGIGEPIWATRTPAELAECHRYEALLNVALGNPDLWLLCPYDTTALDDAVLDEARRNHPYLRTTDISALSSTYPGVGALAGPFDRPLSDSPPGATEFGFDGDSIAEVRRVVASHGEDAGLPRDRVADLVLAAHELATNSIRHGGGWGTLRIWDEPDTVLCEVRDRGHIADPLLDRTRPSCDAESGRGLWLANQLCELVQVRSFGTETGTETVVRLHMYRRAT